MQEQHNKGIDPRPFYTEVWREANIKAKTTYYQI